ncbi:immediate early response 2b [Clinocottus analis]|uniref:immediate early response 2b n=1 Tax=Clinocottus analis TaxID=304258 RepID=UPI0035C0E744
MSATTAMEVNAEARRILAVSISKLYASRTQRGGLRLHRSLLLSMVMRSARDIYHSSREGEEEPCGALPPPKTPEEPMETGEQTALPAEPRTETQQPAAAAASFVEPAASKEEDSGDEGSDGELAEDKENMSPTRQSRKRRGKASAAPDFLPSKRARLEPGEERHAAALPPAGCCRAGAAESLASLSLNRVIPAF